MRGLVLAAALALSACGTAPLTPPAASVPILQADTALDATYNVAAHAYISLEATLTPSVKATVKPLMAQLYTAVSAADTAQRLGDATTMQAQISLAGSLYAQLKPVLRLP